MGIAGYVVEAMLGAVAVAGACAIRRLWMIREGGVRVAVRTKLGAAGGVSGWRLGIGHYRGDRFFWYRVVGVNTKPDRVIPRVGLEIESRRQPNASESYAMPADATVLRCRGRDGELELAMDTDVLTGFLSWLESAPPGRSVPWAS